MTIAIPCTLGLEMLNLTSERDHRDGEGIGRSGGEGCDVRIVHRGMNCCKSHDCEPSERRSRQYDPTSTTLSRYGETQQLSFMQTEHADVREASDGRPPEASSELQSYSPDAESSRLQEVSIATFCITCLVPYISRTVRAEGSALRGHLERDMIETIGIKLPGHNTSRPRHCRPSIRIRQRSYPWSGSEERTRILVSRPRRDREIRGPR